MKKKLGNIPAFTMVEVVVSLVITAIILSLIYVIFAMTAARLDDFRKQGQSTADMNRLTYAINKNIFDSQQMQLKDSILEFLKYDGSRIEYQIAKMYVTRTGERFTDTFHLERCSFRLDTLTGTNSMFRYQRVGLKTGKEKQTLQLHFYKQVYPDQRLTEESHEF